MSTTGIDDDIVVDGNLTVIGGEIDAFTMTVSSTGTLNSNGGNFDLDEDLIIDGTWTDTNSVVIVGNDLQINGTATSTGTSFTVADDFEVDGNFTSSGITLNVTDDINVDGTWVDINSTIDSDDDFNVNGSFTSTGSNIDFADDMVVSGGASVNLTNVNLDVAGDIDIAGSLTTTGGTIDANQITSSGTVTTSSVITLVDDLEVNGGTFNLQGPGTLDVGDDLKVYNGGTFNQFQGSGVNVTNNVVNSDNGGGGGNTTGTFNICDTLTVGGNLTIANTTPNSSLCGCGTGVLDIKGTFSHPETPQCDFFGCAGGGVPCTHSVLPVTWLGFSHALNGDDVQLFWSTASEKNNLGFDVQRANNDLEFQSLGFVDGHGNSNQLRQYEFHDENLKPGTYFYRLVQTDIDQKRDHSEILAVEIGGPAADYVIYPNPSKDVFHLNFPGEELNEIRIQDLMGRTVNVEVSRDAAGIYTLHTGSLGHGLYFVELNSASGVSRTQLIKE